MTPENVKVKLIEVFQEMQTDCGYQGQPITGTTCPFNDLGWFDSYLCLAAITMLSTELNVDIPNDVNIFLSEDGTQRLTINESVDVVCEIVSKGNQKR
ncbi:hypothetical protein GS682_22280 [Nostoc sp. B(2019)]|jgi:hypothetical protein|uniref:Carrier domain-containing protein n=1 Tax=Nostoc cf. edaphicum LEGE 07299 TaxID=2777974 RepID=A0ABR9TVS8_9NOSO|nr:MULTISPECIES: hypothetical protein [Nostocales]MBD2205714.1 hypothetical protein [Calothrix sp. FACHB-168]MBD2220444.1 hypothetical protein [Calothrix sp. FACHB-1219]MBE9104459.1 hypothetical protein [Nostoc cf. edaphicum LEGE 07299]NDJ24326.1 hypothetical protein [Nostoc sp. B(2019)]